MATPTRTSHRIPGALGEILVDVRAASRATPQPAVLLVHGFKGFKDYAFLPPFAERLAKAGFAAVTVSVSGSGVDEAGDFTRLERFRKNTYSIELDDLHVTVQALRAGELGVAPPTSLGVVGHSRGGGMALLFAREVPAVRAVATWAGIGVARRHTDRELEIWRKLGTIEILHQRLRIRLPLDFDVAEDCLAHEHGRLDIPAAARALDRPWLQVHGTADGTVTFEEAERLAADAGAGHEPLWLEGADHTFGAVHPWRGPTPACEQVFDATARFLARHLP
ncbi:MAG TPA: dienelactone hydrolase family protein [Gemmatimonadales bacterium]|nr:dienelactone hydrolase family protein [Gemmatimonadales bacterium]